MQPRSYIHNQLIPHANKKQCRYTSDLGMVSCFGALWCSLALFNWAMGWSVHLYFVTGIGEMNSLNKSLFETYKRWNALRLFFRYI